MKVHPILVSLSLYLSAFPVCYLLNGCLEHPLAIVVTGFAVLSFLFALIYLTSGSRDPLFSVCMVFSFTSGIDSIIAMEEDGYISDFMGFYMREGEPYLTTAHGIMMCYWDAVVHYALYLAMIVAITERKSYRYVGLYWFGSLTMNLVVFLLGNVVGKYGSEIRPSFLLNTPFLVVPIWAATRIFAQPKDLPLVTADKIAEEQRKTLLRRPLDVVLVAYFLFAVVFTLFRGLVVLECPADACFDYLYQQEPYLRDPVAYPRIQMLVYLFYVLPYFCLCIYGLLRPGSAWMVDWALVFAGAIGQAQISHVGSSLHPRTPFPYRTPEGSWWVFILVNMLYTVGPHILAYRCLWRPAFFCHPVSRDENKKTQ